MEKKHIIDKLRDQNGVTAVIIAILLVLFISMAALAIDWGHLHVVKNELQNAADAGALAGARVLYNDEGTSVNTGANLEAHDAAEANKSENVAVEVNWTAGNDGDVQRGHWSFGMTPDLPRGFTPNASTAPVNLANVSAEELDADINFINAVRVTARRNDIPAASFFARIFGFDSFQRQADAVAYIGFAGTLTPGDVDQPIAICKESITDAAGNYDCSIGRMINSGSNDATNNTGGWTSFAQQSEDNPDFNPCSGGTNAQEMRSLICNGGNPDIIQINKDMATSGGEIQSAFNQLISCWQTASNGRTQSWNLTLPVITCPSNNVGTCEEVVGAVNLDIVWITGPGEDPDFTNAPTHMDGWSNTSSDGSVRWKDFVAAFQLHNQDGSDAPYAKKSIYFKPSCNPRDLAGGTGGPNLGILARIPVLVK